MTSTITIRDFEPAYATAYRDLNIQWISEYFRIEKHDLEQLENPQEYIISKGGFIFFAVDGDEVIGTCALIRTSDTEFELAKMAVLPAAQGRKIGKQLGIAALNRAQEQGATRVWLESN